MAEKLTPQEEKMINKVIEQLQANTGVREYVGARYVPLIDGEWDETKEYEPLTIVLNEGDSYTSKQYVPAGIPLTNETYWALTGNFNGSVAAIKQQVNALEEEQTAQAGSITSLQTEQTAQAGSITSLQTEQTAQAGSITSLQTEQNILAARALLKNTSLLFLGDSITWGQGDQSGNTVEKPWPTVFGESVQALSVKNIAVGGATGATNTPASSNAKAQADSVNEYADYVFLMFGTNDYGYAVKPYSTYYGILEACQSLSARYPTMKIVGVIPPYMDGDHTPNSLGLTALAYKQAALQAFNEAGAAIIDFTHGLSWNEQNWNQWLLPWDLNLTRLHPNQAGHTLMGEYAARAFKPVGQWVTMCPNRDQNGHIPTSLGTGASWANSENPGLVWEDPFTGTIHVDLGEGMIIGSGFNGKLFDAPGLSWKPFRTYYGSAGGYKGNDIYGLSLVMNESGIVSALGNIPTGLTICGSLTIPWMYNNTTN